MENKEKETEKRSDTRGTRKFLGALTEAAVLVALALALSFFKLKIGGLGGSIDLVMVPLIVLAYRRGAKWAVPAGAVFGLVKCIIGGGIGYGFASVMLDYVIAYAAVGVAGFFNRMKHGLVIGTVVGSLARFIVHFISGVTIYKLATAEEFWGMTFQPSAAVGYSLLYNASYMVPNMIVAIIAVYLLKAAIEHLELKRQDD
ncbi:MAG: energy-coupled thiamine transporter ThiT [Clostridia bacterium]|nr:energy-coupled thiamine transporter ThiT [Clostridia bacterium]